MLKRIAINIIWATFPIAIAVIISVCAGLSIPYIVVGIIASLLLGIAIGERKGIARWLVNIYRATRILLRQESNPKTYIQPYIKSVDLFPDMFKKETTPINYIRLVLSWHSHMFRKVEIEDVKGEIQIEGSSPPDKFFHIGIAVVEPLGDLHLTNISIILTEEALHIVKSIRNKGYGKADVTLKVSARIDGKAISYSGVSCTAYFM